MTALSISTAANTNNTQLCVQDFMAGIINVIVGMSDESRQIVRGHLDFNKWEHSGVLDCIYYLWGLC
jgi:hypothetical protein